jgi:Tfp pilus assembly pilus retraction ATPase PilT
MRDPETIQSSHRRSPRPVTPSFADACTPTTPPRRLDRIWDVFPHERQEQIKVQLASLAGVISQRLVPEVDGGMAPFEAPMPRTRSATREGKTHL